MGGSGSVGADLSTMQNLHKGLGEHADQVTTLKNGLRGHVDNTQWTGANANKFRAAVDEFMPHLDKINQAMTEAQTDVRTQHNNIAAATGENASL